jgi:hypothetical protein
MPYATYGQLVTPQAPMQAPAAAAHSSAGLAGGSTSASATAGSALTEGPSPPTYQAASGMPVVTDPFAGFQGSSATSTQPDIQQPYDLLICQQQASTQHLPSAGASTPRGLSPEPVVNRDVPLFVTVTEPVKKEASGMLGMKGRQCCEMLMVRQMLATLCVTQHTLLYVLTVPLVNSSNMALLGLSPGVHAAARMPEPLQGSGPCCPCATCPCACAIKLSPRTTAVFVCLTTASHIEYLVTTRSQLPGWSAPEVAVRRRFRDFVALAELLKVCPACCRQPARMSEDMTRGGICVQLRPAVAQVACILCLQVCLDSASCCMTFQAGSAHHISVLHLALHSFLLVFAAGQVPRLLCAPTP